eukprot:CAMPEP_0172760082 /NCGR_PEP_ID=MMETSP1074-20121228/168986_1 /TAXON_ID=2916 /ORGANISM="Ceratium fusus, Strain PA161109" /LENGTH=70 /DNA_ID=CAMNT_0013594001 /DNA_START=30 /DNA_END=238 /DNA_ORIENTATION=-
MKIQRVQHTDTNNGHCDETGAAHNHETEHLPAASGNSVAPSVVNLPTAPICLEAKTSWSDTRFDRSTLST